MKFSLDDVINDSGYFINDSGYFINDEVCFYNDKNEISYLHIYLKQPKPLNQVAFSYLLNLLNEF